MKATLTVGHIPQYAQILVNTERGVPHNIKVSAKFMYWLSWTSQKIGNEAAHINKAIAAIDGWNEFVSKREELFASLGSRDSENEKFADLQEEYRSAVDGYTALMNKEQEMDLRPLPIDLVPDNTAFYPVVSMATAIFGTDDDGDSEPEESSGKVVKLSPQNEGE